MPAEYTNWKYNPPQGPPTSLVRLIDGRHIPGMYAIAHKYIYTVDSSNVYVY